MVEVWRKVRGSPGYWVSSLGAVRSPRKQLKLRHHPNGYRQVVLGRNKYAYVHRLVLFAFDDPPADGQECLHKDNDRANNRLDNLCWGTHKDNQAQMAASGNAKGGKRLLTAEQVVEIRLGKRTDAAWAAEFGVTEGAVWAARTGQTWRGVQAPAQRRNYPSGSPLSKTRKHLIGY